MARTRILDYKCIGYYCTTADTFGGIIKTASSIKIVRPKDTQNANTEHVNANKVKEEPMERVLAYWLDERTSTSKRRVLVFG